MTENHTLRGLIRSLAGFIGEGTGGLISKLGWELGDFQSFVNKSETDTAWEGYQRRKKSNASGEASSSTPQLQVPKRPVEDELATSRKKSRYDEPECDLPNSYPLGPMSHPIPTSYAPPTRPQERNGMFSDLIKGRSASSLYIQQSPPINISSSYNPVPDANTELLKSSYISNVNMTIESPLSTVPFDSSSSRSGSSQQQQVSTNTPNDSDELEIDDDPNKNEAYKLIQYVDTGSWGVHCQPFPGTISTTLNAIPIIVYRYRYAQHWFRSKYLFPFACVDQVADVLMENGATW